MDLLSLILVLIVVGVLLWAIEKYVPMDAQIKRLIHIVVLVVVVLWLLSVFGVIDAVRGVQVPRA